jgi:outer membrane lipoprotein carrier protein
MVKQLRILILLILLPCLSLAAKKADNADMLISPSEEKYFGDDDIKPSIYKIYAKELKEIEKYLNSFQTFSSTFKQSNKDNSINYGKLLISKPGKIRCEYFKPSPVLIIINDNRITYYDKQLDELSYTSANVNALKFLALDNVNFSSLKIVEAEKDNNFISLYIQEDSQELKQTLFLKVTFSYPKVSLKQLTIITEESEIDMAFDQIVYNKTLGKKLFTFNRGFPKRRS